MDDEPSIKDLPLTRRLEFRGRLFFGEAMSSPEDARLAVREIRRQQRTFPWWMTLAVVAGLVMWRVLDGAPWSYFVILAAYGLAGWTMLRRALRANEAAATPGSPPREDASPA